jgi:hypothetical protein
MVATEGSLTLSYRTAGPVTLTGDDLSIEDVVRIAPGAAPASRSHTRSSSVSEGLGTSWTESWSAETWCTA